MLKSLQALFSSLVSASDASIRSLAQKTLERLPLDASNLIPMLRTPDLAPKTPTPTKSGRKKAKTTSVEKDPSQSNSSGDICQFCREFSVNSGKRITS